MDLYLTSDLTPWTPTTTVAPVRRTWWTRPAPPSPSTGCWRTTPPWPAGRSTSTRARWWSWSRSGALAGGTSGSPGTTWRRAGPPPPTWRSSPPGTGHWTVRSVRVSSTAEWCWPVNCSTVRWQQFSRIMITPTINKISNSNNYCRDFNQREPSCFDMTELYWVHKHNVISLWFESLIKKSK